MAAAGASKSAGNRRAEGPVIGVVVPLFKHSVLVADALASFLRQESGYASVAVVVNDGCPFSDSELQVEALRALHPARIHTVYRTNGGLSAARNTGIGFLLATYPSIEAIFFLDSDNRLRPKALESAYRTLCDHPEADWVYPNIDMFGLRRHFDYAGPYSLLRHVFYNICEAGSMVRRRVFAAGVRFDETMQLGFEDWDFWLSAAGRGFRGVHDPNFGFLYRNRPASMLSQSKRDAEGILAYMRRKHRAIMSPRALLRLEAEEAPRHAIVYLDADRVEIGLGGGAVDTVSIAAFGEMLWRAITAPTLQHVPPIIIFTGSGTAARLRCEGVLLWIAYDAETVLTSSNVAAYEIEDGIGGALTLERGGLARDSGLLAVGFPLIGSILRDEATSWVELLPKGGADSGVLAKRLLLPAQKSIAAGREASAMSGFLHCVRLWRDAPYREAAKRNWTWRELSVPPSHQMFNEVRQVFGGAVAFPQPPGGTCNIGFVLHVASFGGVERVAYCVARELARAGAAVHLFLIGANRAELPEDFKGTFASISCIEGAGLGAWDGGTRFQGTALPAITKTPEALERVVAALAWLDIVVNHHAGDLNEAAAALRRLGVKTATYLHLLDTTPSGRVLGHPLLALAYEHAYDRVICVSRRMLSWMHGAGVPADKLLLVPNAPGHEVSQVRRRRVLKERRERQHQRLRVLFLGRLDRQKGIDRLAAVMEKAIAADIAVRWRVVGAAVTEAVPVPSIVQSRVEPPVYGAKGLTELLSWADVLVLLSDYEGVPLSILEAQRLGVVVIATNVGAVSEVIDSERNGILVDPKHTVDETLKWLKRLAEDDAVRARIALAASDVPNWWETTGALIEWAGLTPHEDAKEPVGGKREVAHPVSDAISSTSSNL